MSSTYSISDACEKYDLPNDLEDKIRFTINPHRDEQILRRLYIDHGLTQAQVGEILNADQTTISKWLQENDIATRPGIDEIGERSDRAEFYTVEHGDGRIQWFHWTPDDGLQHIGYLHQFVALHDFSVNEVFDDDTDINHMLGSSYVLDLPANLEVLGKGVHARRHAEGTATVDDPETVLQHIYGEFEPFTENDEDDR